MILRPVLWLGLAYITGEIVAYFEPEACWFPFGMLILGAGFWILGNLWDRREEEQRKAGKKKRERGKKKSHLRSFFLSALTFCRDSLRRIKQQVRLFFFVLSLFLCFGYLNFIHAYQEALRMDERLETYVADLAAESSGSTDEEDSGNIYIEGKVYAVEEKTNSWYLYLKDCEELFGEKILVTISKDTLDDLDEWLTAGDSISCRGEVELFEHASNEGEFDSWMYYHAKGLSARFWADSVAQTAKTSSPWNRFCKALKVWMKQNYQACLDDSYSGVAFSMACNDKSLLDADLKELYQMSGIAHILAISGLHISFIGRGLYRLLKSCRVSERVALAIALLVMIGYGFFTGMAVSTCRAVLMMGLAFGARFFGRTSDRPTSLVLAALCILIPSPLTLTQTGFLLSFTAVGSLCFLPAQETKEEETKKEKTEKKEYREGRWALIMQKFLPNAKKGWRSIAFAKMRSQVLSGLFVTIGMLPMTAWCFYEIPLYGMFVNLAVIPLLNLLFPLVFFCGLAGSLLGPVGLLLGKIVEEILSFYELLCRLSLSLPGAIQIVGKPKVYELLLTYGFFLVAVLLFRGKRKHREQNRKSLTMYLPGFKFLWIACGIALLMLPRTPSQMTVTMLDVGQGDCFFIQTPEGTNLLIDCGSTDESEVGTYVLLPFLKSRGVRQIDAVVISHMDADHMNGIVELLEEGADGAAGSIRVDALFFGCNVITGGNYEEVFSLVQELEIDCYSLKAGDNLAWGELTLRVLSPQEDLSYADRNDGSLVLSLSYGKFDALFTGDISEEVEESVLETLQEYNLGTYDLLKVAHHGSRTASSTEFLETVCPTVAFISCGKDNSYGHPHAELLERLQAVTDTIYVTSQVGETILKTDGNLMKTVVWSE